MGAVQARPQSGFSVCQQSATVLSRFQFLPCVSHGPRETPSPAPAVNPSFGDGGGGGTITRSCFCWWVTGGPNGPMR